MAKTTSKRADESYSNINSTTPVAEHPSLDEVYEETPFSEAFWTYLNYVILNIFGWFRDLLRGARIENRKGSAENNPSVSPPIRSFSKQRLLFFTNDIYLLRVSFHSIKAMKASTPATCISVLPIASIDRLAVYPVERSIWWSVSPMITIGHSSKTHPSTRAISSQNMLFSHLGSLGTK